MLLMLFVLVLMCIKTLLAYGLSTFPSKDNPAFSNGPKRLPRNYLDCPVLYNGVFDNLILADKPIERTL